MFETLLRIELWSKTENWVGSKLKTTNAKTHTYNDKFYKPLSLVLPVLDFCDACSTIQFKRLYDKLMAKESLEQKSWSIDTNRW